MVIGGDGSRAGLTKVKSVLVEFFLGDGIEPWCVASHDHLGHNRGRNLTSPKQVRGKETSTANVVDDTVASTAILLSRVLASLTFAIFLNLPPMSATGVRFG